MVGQEVDDETWLESLMNGAGPGLAKHLNHDASREALGELGEEFPPIVKSRQRALFGQARQDLASL